MYIECIIAVSCPSSGSGCRQSKPSALTAYSMQSYLIIIIIVIVITIIIAIIVIIIIIVTIILMISIMVVMLVLTRIIGEKVQPTVVSELLYSFSRDFGQRGTYVEVGMLIC